MFEILLHTTFEIETSEFHQKADNILTTNSGAEVQNAIIVNQITSEDIFIFFAILAAPSTNTSAHFIRKTNPIISNI